MHVLKYTTSSFWLFLSTFHVPAPSYFGTMKWITVVSCLLLVNFAESKNLPRRYRDIGQPVLKLTDLTGRTTEALSLGVFSQFLQQATFEEVHKLVEDVAALSKKCLADGSADSRCHDSVLSFFPNQMCDAHGLPEKYGYADCCAKADQERSDCLISRKNATPGFIPPFQKPDAREVCRQFQANPNVTVQRFIYERARRDPMKLVQSFFDVIDGYKELLTTCCQAAEKEPCFNEKALPAPKRFLEFKTEPQIHCVILKTFGTRALESVEHILLSQQFPRADVSTVFRLAKYLAEEHIDCCRGDSLKCFFHERNVANYLCSHQETISSKLKEVCEKEWPDRNSVLALAENDDQPSDLPPIAREFIEDKDVCRQYAENQADHLGKFRYENGRRHPELPPYLLLRHAEGYERLLKNCCAVVHPEQCLPQGEGQLEKHVADTLQLMKFNCHLYGQLGDYRFQSALLVRLTKNIPQWSFEELYQYTKEMTEAASECCPRNDTENLACSELKVETILGSICSRHQQKPINTQIGKCCNNSFPFWMQCFAGLGVDADYTPTAFDPKRISNLCSIDADHQEKKKQKLLVNLIKHNPNIAEEQVDAILMELQKLLNCCQAENVQECFKEEGQKLTNRVKAAPGEH